MSPALWQWRGNEKGRVERAIRYVRASFFAAREFTDRDNLDAQAEAWCSGLAADRRCPEDPKRSVREAFAEEASCACCRCRTTRRRCSSASRSRRQDALCPV